jgi:hypothetical protein
VKAAKEQFNKAFEDAKAQRVGAQARIKKIAIRPVTRDLSIPIIYSLRFTETPKAWNLLF